MLIRGLIPTPPAMNTARRMLEKLMSGGGQTKLPPTRTERGAERSSEMGCQSQAAGGFSGER